MHVRRSRVFRTNSQETPPTQRTMLFSLGAAGWEQLGNGWPYKYQSKSMHFNFVLCFSRFYPKPRFAVRIVKQRWLWDDFSTIRWHHSVCMCICRMCIYGKYLSIYILKTSENHVSKIVHWDPCDRQLGPKLKSGDMGPQQFNLYAKPVQYYNFDLMSMWPLNWPMCQEA